MNDLISRQAAIDMFQNLAYDDWNQGVSTTWANAFAESADMIKGLPSAQPERKNGEWIRWYEEIENDTCTEYIPHCKCSECGKEYDPHTVKFINFCSYCGAEMER